jgi:cysteine-rich repeat protein
MSSPLSPRVLVLAAASILVVASCTLERSGGSLFSDTSSGPSATSAGSGGDPDLTTVSTVGPSTSASQGGHGAMAGAGGAGGAGGVGGVGGTPKVPVCGDGEIDSGEACDDDNLATKDGCDANCQIEDGWACRNEPSDCVEIIVVKVNPKNELLDDDYDGTLDSMFCVDIDVTTSFTMVGKVWIEVKLKSSNIGDVVIKLQSPASTILTLLSRPGHLEPADTADMVQGAVCNFEPSGVITFDDDALYLAEDMGEDMGNPIGDGKSVCKDNPQICEYKPSPGAGPGMTLADFKGEDPNGEWKLCTADANLGNINNAEFHETTLSIIAWP